MDEIIKKLEELMQEEIDEYTEGYNDGIIVAIRTLEQNAEG